MTEAELDPFGMPRAGADAAPASTPERAAADPSPARGPRDRRWLSLLFMALALVGLGLMLWQQDRRALDSPQIIARDVGGHALAPASLVRADRLRAALAAVRAQMTPGEELVGLRLVPTELSTRIRDDHGNLRLVDVDLAGKVRSTDWSTDTSSTPIDLAAIDPAVPQRIVATALRQAGADDTHLGGLSLNGFSDDAPTWSIQLRDVRIGDQSWSADLAGLAVTHPGQLPAASGLTGRSLLAPGPLKAALTKVARVGTRATAMRLQPDRLDVTVRADGGRRDVFVDAAQRVTVRETPGGGSDEAALAIARIDPAGPRRAVAKVLERAGASPSRIGYLTLQLLPPIAGGTSWAIFLDDRVPSARRAWRASLDGRKVRPL